MTKMLTEDAVIARLAKAVVDRTVAALVASLDDMHDCLSGDDSGLESVWEEVCVQIQHEESVHWATYEEMVRGLIDAEVPKLQDYEKAAIWFQTDAGLDWACSEPEERDSDPYVDDDVAEYIVKALYSFASDFERDNIRQYLTRTTESDA